MNKKIFPAVLAAASILTNSASLSAFAESVSGNWNGLDWEIHNHVLTISGTGAIHCCTWTFPDDDMLEIPEWFDYAQDIQEIVIQNGVTGAEEHALSGFPNLEKITLPESFTFLDPNALSDNPNLAEISGLENVEQFGFQCLSNTKYIAENPFVIHDNALYYAEGTEFTVPDGVQEIKPFAFGNFTGENFIAYPKNENQSVYYEITLPDSVQNIDDYAFAYCSTMTGINIPDSVQNIGDYAFFNCVNLDNLTLGENLSAIGENAFFNCKNLNQLTILNPETNFQLDAYGNALDWAETLENPESGRLGLLERVPQTLLEEFPFCLDEMMSYINLHFFETKPYSTDQNPSKQKTITQGAVTGHIGSTAQKFARQQELPFRPLEDGIFGDMDDDGETSILDVISVNRYILGKSAFSDKQNAFADVDQDGQITPADALLMMKKIVGIVDEF